MDKIRVCSFSKLAEKSDLVPKPRQGNSSVCSSASCREVKLVNQYLCAARVSKKVGLPFRVYNLNQFREMSLCKNIDSCRADSDYVVHKNTFLLLFKNLSYPESHARLPH